MIEPATRDPAEEATSVDPAVVQARTLLRHVATAAAAYRRQDLERFVTAAIDRLGRPETVVCVVGEFKQGKSSLINGLIGVAACPVDDDLATAAVTVVRHGPELDISVRRRAGLELVEEHVAPERLPDIVSERGNPENRLGIELVQIRVPNPLLERGWVFVDTPGIGGLNPAQAAAGLAFLPAANALLFVSDAAAELTATELEFLARARQACPMVLVAVSKVDQYPAWREVLAANRSRLHTAGIDVQPVPVSSLLRVRALQTADEEMHEESGFPLLLRRLHEEVLATAAAGGLPRSIDDGRHAIRQLRLPLEREAAAQADPTATAAPRAELVATKARLQELRGPSARWLQRLNDGFADSAATADYRFRASMRRILRDAEARIDAHDPARLGDSLASGLQGDSAEAVGRTFTELVDAAAALRSELASLIRDEAFATQPARGQGIDVAELWSARPVTQSAVKTGVGMGFGALRGAQSGVLLLGMLGSLFNFALIGPVLLGGAAVFAGKSVLDEKKRLLGQRRQEARATVRQYVEDVQFEVGTRMRELIRELQRELRDDVATRLDELQRTLSDASAALERSLTETEATRSSRRATIDVELSALADLDGRLSSLRQGHDR